MKYKHIVFDMDGTLVDNEYAIFCSFLNALRKVDYDYTQLEDLTFILGIPGEEALKRLELKDRAKTLEIWTQELQNKKIPTQLFEGIDEILEDLKQRGYHLGIVTSKTQDLYNEEVEGYGIAQYFDTCIFAKTSARPKPYPDPLLKYMENTQTSPKDILYVGDSFYDMECAKNAGVDFVWACWGTKKEHLNQGYYQLKSPSEIIDII